MIDKQRDFFTLPACQEKEQQGQLRKGGGRAEAAGHQMISTNLATAPRRIF
jgi:hypothetical protein